MKHNKSTVIIKDDISKLVSLFYAKVRKDELLAEVFNTIIKDWEHHLSKITDFWASIMLQDKSYSGSPFLKHMNLRSHSISSDPEHGVLLKNGVILKKAITEEHFTRWLDLFAQTAQEIFVFELAHQFIEKSQMIGKSLKMGMFPENQKI